MNDSAQKFRVLVLTLYEPPRTIPVETSGTQRNGQPAPPQITAARSRDMAKKITDIMAWVKTHRRTRVKKEGLRLTQVRILYALHANPDGMTRDGIAKFCGVGEQSLIVSIGPLDPSCRDSWQKKKDGYPGLLALDMIQPDIKVLDDAVGEQLVYVITKQGEKEYKRWYAEYGDELPAPRVGNPKDEDGEEEKKPKAKKAPKPAASTNGSTKKAPKPAAVKEEEGSEDEVADDEEEAESEVEEPVGF